MYKIRIKKIREELEKKKIDALLISDPINIEYLTGFNGSYGFLLVNPGGVCLFTDSRYYQRCRKETIGVRVRLIKDGWLLPYKPKRLAFEACSVDYNTYREWKHKFRGVKLVPTRYLVEQVRMIKQPEELRAIRSAIRITEGVINKLRKRLRDGISRAIAKVGGVSEIELARQIEDWIRKIPSAQLSFSPIVAYGANSSMPHAGLSKKRLRNNQLVLIDLGAKVRGYSSDLTRTFWMGRITRKFREIYNIVLTAQQMAIDIIVPGRRISEIDAIARSYIKKKGYGRYFGHPLGHGVGISVHEIPRVGPKNRYVLKPGMVFTVEPGVYIPGWGGVRIEDMVLVTDKGCEVLTSSPKDLTEITIN